MGRPNGQASVDDRRARRDTPVSGATSPSNTSNDDASGVIHIVAGGDVVLEIEHQLKTSKAQHAFRCSTTALRSSSKYFSSLMQPGRFGEGAAIESKHRTLRAQNIDFAKVSASELPVIHIEDLGRISEVKSIDQLLTDFLNILHGADTQAVPPVANLANLAIVADRFDALDVVGSYVQRKKIARAIEGKTTPKAEAGLGEEKARQRLLVGILLDYPPWTEKYSARLVIKGWVGRESESSSALWWDLPRRIEEELSCRRDYVLETVQSLQSYFLGLYMSRERQCKLGYDSSAQCDAFQLGEMMRFFGRVETIRLQGTIFEADEAAAPYSGDVLALLDTLRQVPEYQIDKFHAHCGIRTRMVPLLDVIRDWVQHVGICAECWSRDRRGYAWVESNRPLLWRRQTLRARPQGHDSRHADVRAIFTATERDWSA